MSIRGHVRRTLLLVFASGGLAGCGSAVPLQLASAEGLVTIHGKPAPNVMVQFMPQVEKGAPGPTSTGVTDENGKFKLVSQDGKDGVLVGKCKVVLADLDESRPPQGKPV